MLERKKWKSKNGAGRFSLELNTPKYINVFRQPSKKAAGVRNENRGFYVATGIVQRRDVSILYSVILTSSKGLRRIHLAIINQSVVLG